MHLPSSYFPDSLGGTEVYVRQLVDALEALGHHGSIAWHTDSSHVLPPAFALPRLEASRRGLQRCEGTSEPSGFGALLDRLRPDVVHFHAFTLGAGMGHARMLRARGIPYLVTFHTPSMACPRGTWMLEGTRPCDGVLDPRRCSACALMGRGWPRSVALAAARSPLSARIPAGPLITRMALPSLLAAGFAAWRDFFLGAQRVIACAEFVRERLIRNGVPETRIVLQRQALPGSTRTRQLQLPPQDAKARVRVGFFGRVTAVKGPDLLVRAVAKLRAQRRRAEVELVGPVLPQDQRWLTHEVLSGAPWAKHLGPLEGDALSGWLSSMDIIAIPSRWLETGPLSLLEAWDASRVVVGCDLGGISEFMRPQGQQSLLFEHEDVNGLAGSLLRALSGDGYSRSVVVPGMDDLAFATAELYAQAVASAPDSASLSRDHVSA